MTDIHVSPERPNQVLFSLPAGKKSHGEKGLPCRIAFLDESIVRVTVDPAGEFAQYARPVSPDHVARIQAQPDESPVYAHPAVTVRDEGDLLAIVTGETEVLLAKSFSHLKE